MKRLLAVLLSAALLAWLASDGRWRELAAGFARLDARALLPALAGLALSYGLRSLRVYDEFRHESRAQGRYIACLRIVLVHNALVNVLPFRGGEAAFPLLLRQTFGTPMPRALASLFWFRLQDALVVGIVAMAVWPGLAPALRGAAVVALLLLAFCLPRWARADHDWADRGPLAAKLARLRDALGESTRHARLGWLWTVANWSVKLAAQSWLLAALLDLPLTGAAAGALGAELAAILPIQGVAGFGTYEAGAAAALLPAGIAFEAGLRAALTLHLFIIASAVTAGALAALLSARKPADGSGPDTRSGLASRSSSRS